MNPVLGHDQTVFDWACQQFGKKLVPCHSAIGLIDGEGKLRGAAIFQEWNGSNIEFSYYGTSPLTRGAVRYLVQYCFDGVGANRITVRVPKRQKTMLRSLPKLGFRFEGVLRRYYGPFRKDDAVMFGLLPTDASRILKVVRNEPV